MFLTDCQTCGRRDLRGARSIEMLVNTDGGAVLVYSCTKCGTTNALHPATATPAVATEHVPAKGDLVAA